MLRIIVEGNDKIFIERYIEICLSKRKDIDFAVINAGGWTTLHLFSTDIDKYIDNGDGVCIIFDADSSANGGGYNTRLAAIQDQVSKIADALSRSLVIPIFLWPNNSLDGDIEVALEEISNDDRKVVYSCFDDYETCIKSKLTAKGKAFNSPLRKSRIFAYTETLPLSKKFKKKEAWSNDNFLFENSEYWNLNSPFLQPLKDFLNANL